MYGVSRPGIRLKKPPRPVISINDPPGATSLFTYHAIPLDAPRIPHDHLRQKRRHAELRKKAADRERERRRAARQAKQQAELREQQARARRQARPRSAPATRRPSVEERALDTAIASAEPRTTVARPKSAPARRRPPMVPRPTIAELMARQREALSIPRCARLRPPPGSFYRDFVREAPPVGSYEVTYPVKKTTAKGDQSMRYPTGARAPRPSIRKKASDYGYSRTHTNPVDQARALAAEGPGAGAYSLPPTYGVRKSFNRRAGPGGIGAFDLRARF